MFLSVIIPSTISIITVYITNNKINDIKDIVGVTLTYIFAAFIISFTLYAVLDIKNLMVNRRRNFIELKDVLRNININENETKKKERRRG